MSRLGGLLSWMSWVSLLWQECCENPAIFCYRISWSFVVRDAAPVAHRPADKQCSSRLKNFFTLSMTSRD